MAQINLKGNPINTVGDLPPIGSTAPEFTLTKSNLSNASLAEFKGKQLILNIFPSLDTGTCAVSVRNFNKEAASLENTTVLCISHDLPFAHARFCAAEGIKNVVMLSGFRNPEFSDNYGIRIIDAPMNGLCARSVVVLDENGIVKYAEFAPETTKEPDYEAALAAL